MFYSNMERLLNAGKQKKCKRKITQEDRMSIASCLANCSFNANTIQAVWKIFLFDGIDMWYIQNICCWTEQYGLHILSESAMYKNLPKFVCCQKYIPFIECPCVKCLNFSLLVDALRVAGIIVKERAILNVIASICPFLVEKDNLDKIPEVLPQENTNKKNPKTKGIQFRTSDHIEYDIQTFKMYKNIHLLLLTIPRKNRNMILISFC